MKKILFIQPPVEDFYITSIRRQPLGILYLISVAKKLGYSPFLLNCHSKKRKVIQVPQEFNYLKSYIEKGLFPFRYYSHWGLSWDEIEKRIKSSEVDLFAISSLFTTYYQEVDKVIDIIRKYHKKPIIIGGHHPSLYPEYYFEKGIDFIIKGEAENSFAKVLLYMEMKDESFLHDENIIAPFIASKRVNNSIKIDLQMEKLIPDRSLLKNKDFMFYRGKKGVSIISSKGCPHRCSFCTSKIVFKEYKTREMDLIVKEIQECINNFGIEIFNFEDDNLFADRERSVKLLSLLSDIKNKYNNIEFVAMNGISIEKIDYEILRMMKEAGFYEINLSLGTLYLSNQKLYNRPFSSLHFERIVGYSKRLGFNCRAYFILGLPNQTKEEIKEIKKFFNRLKIKAFPSVYYNVFNKKKDEWKIQRSSAFPNETEYLSRDELIYFFNLFLKDLESV